MKINTDECGILSFKDVKEDIMGDKTMKLIIIGGKANLVCILNDVC